MRAIGMSEYGPADVLRELDLPAEPMHADGVRVRVHAATVNPTDLGLREGSRPRPEGGIDVPGMEVAGVVTELGPDATGLTLGDHVFGIVVQSGQHGGYRDEVVLPHLSVVRVPAGSDAAHAATLPMNGLTAVQALDVLELEAGQVLAVTGAAGAVGGYAIQLAKVAGLVVVADASEADAAMVRRLGADVVVGRGAGFGRVVRERYPDGVDGLVDGALLGAAARLAVRDGGAVATVRGDEGDGLRGLRVTPVAVRRYALHREKLERLRDLAERGALTMRVAGELHPHEAADAHRRLAAGGVRGRLVLRFG